MFFHSHSALWKSYILSRILTASELLLSGTQHLSEANPQVFLLNTQFYIYSVLRELADRQIGVCFKEIVNCSSIVQLWTSFMVIKSYFNFIQSFLFISIEIYPNHIESGRVHFCKVWSEIFRIIQILLS